MDYWRCLALLWITVFSSAHAQVFYVAAPNTFRLNADETIAIAVDGNDALVEVFIQDYPGRIKNITNTRLQVNKGQPEIFKVNLNPAEFPPNFLTNANSEQLVVLIVHSRTFHKEVRVPLNYQAGYVFIQTDKPIYTPKQTVQFRIISLNENGLPSDEVFKLQIKNPKNVILEETTFNNNPQTFSKAFKTHKYKFPNYPILGDWTAVVSYGYQLKQNTTVQFELQEYVLPTFTVDLKTPEIILEADETFRLTVNARYVYGKPVKGMVTFRLGIKGDAPETIIFGSFGPKNLQDGYYQEVLSTKNFGKNANITYFPDMVGSHLVVEAIVTDEATGNKEAVIDARTRFAKSQYIISFERCLTDFKPGLVSVFEADIKYINGKAAEKVDVRITAKADGKDLVIADPSTKSDAEGRVAFKLHPELTHKTLTITLETSGHKGAKAVGHFFQSRFNSSSNAFIAIERSSTHNTKIDDSFTKLIHIHPPHMKDLYYAIVSKGNIVNVSKLPEGQFKTQQVTFRLTSDMAPSFRLLVWAHYGDELIADSLKVNIEHSCSPKAKVVITPEFNTREPGSAGNIIISGTKDTLVGLLGVDEAVYALSKRDILTKDKMFKTFANHDLGCGPGGGLNTDDVLSKAGIIIASTKHTPPLKTSSSCVAIKRRKRSVASDILSSYSGLDKQCCALGMSHDIHSRSCEARTNIVTRYLKGENQNCSRAFLACCLHAKENGVTNMKLMRTGLVLGRMGGQVDIQEPLFISEEEEEFFEKVLSVRSDFRETWFFKDQVIGPDNKEEFGVSLPHSITTWVISAVSVSPDYGMCIAEPQKIVSFKKVFVQLNLPYSVVRNEQIEIQATVFNYGDTRIGSVVYMYGVKDLCSGANEGEKSERKRVFVEKQSAATVTFPVIPLKDGTFDLKVVALSPEGSDAISKKLNVIAEGYPVEFDIPIKLDPTNQQRREKRHISTESYSDNIDPTQNLQITAIKLPAPEDFVPGTESCTISALGDQFGATIETSLNTPDKLLLKPHGCGEQNMMFFAPTLYTMRYLKVKGKISPEVEEKGYSFIRHGFGNQMSFRKNDGSYAAYLNKPTSTWLTAFVIKVFCQANELIHIAEDIMCSGIRWLMSNQQPDGAFIENSPVYHMDMMGGVQGKTPLTAFTLITLEECRCDAENLHISKKRALAYLENHLGDVEEPLAVAVMAYALALSDSNLKQAANDRLLSIAKHDADRNLMYWGDGNKAEDIEATSYALLNQLLFSNMEKGNSIVNWLNTQQLQSGSFKSTQDTVVALQALSEYAIRAQMPAMHLVSNITSSNDRNFREVLNFHEGNAHVLQNIKVNKIGGMLFVNTAGHGVGSLTVKMRYNLLHPPEDLCKFDVTVNVSEIKQERRAFAVDPRHGGKDMFNLFPEDLIRGVQEALNQEVDIPIIDVDPRNRGPQKASLVAGGNVMKVERLRRVKRQDRHGNSKRMLKISICARHLGNKDAGMSIVDVGIFSGFIPNEEDLKELENDESHLIDMYERSGKGIVFYLHKIPSREKYCFQFRVTQEYIVGDTKTSIVKVYDYYNPDETCTVFYSPGSNSPLLHTLCDNGICQCAEGECPPKTPFEEYKNLDQSQLREKLRDDACEKFDFVWMGELSEEMKKDNGFYNISFQIDEVIKAGIEKKEDIEGETRNFLARDNCPALFTGVTYLILGQDGQKYKSQDGRIWHRYLLDKRSVVHMWTAIKVAKERELQRALNNVVKKLKNEGCLL